MPVRLLTIAIFLAPLACPAETLRELLTKNHLPLVAFSQQELGQTVQGETAISGGQTVLAYNGVKGEGLTAPLHLVRFGRDGKAILRRDAVMKPEENCDGSLLGISFLHGLTALATHINPSASCLLFFDREFRMVRRIYGIDWKEVAPNQLVIVENTIHFAAVHPERLKFANLLRPGSSEVYPLKNDALRGQFIAEHAKHIPSESICAAANDPCSPDAFDEDVLALTTDGKGRFGFIAILNARHAMGADKEPDSVLSRMILYIYQQDNAGWLYCEKAIPDVEIESVRALTSVEVNPPAAACNPSIPVIANGSTAGFNPFQAN